MPLLRVTDVNSNVIAVKKDQVLYVYKGDTEETPGGGNTIIVLVPGEDNNETIECTDSVSDIADSIDLG